MAISPYFAAAGSNFKWTNSHWMPVGRQAFFLNCKFPERRLPLLRDILTPDCCDLSILTSLISNWPPNVGLTPDVFRFQVCAKEDVDRAHKVALDSIVLSVAARTNKSAASSVAPGTFCAPGSVAKLTSVSRSLRFDSCCIVLRLLPSSQN